MPNLPRRSYVRVGYDRVSDNPVNNFSHAYYCLCVHTRGTPMETERREEIACLFQVDLAEAEVT